MRQRLDQSWAIALPAVLMSTPVLAHSDVSVLLVFPGIVFSLLTLWWMLRGWWQGK